MPPVLLRGGQAIAHGAIASGIKMVTSYPGSPSSEVVETMIAAAGEHNIQVEWSSNERVALETAIGVSIAGGRSLVCTKSVGMNVMLDPLMALNLTPLNGGLVIVLGDDPGGYGSQNDQDTRWLAHMLEIPMLEPSTPAEAFAMTREAFAIAERFELPVIVRETRSFSQAEGSVDLPSPPFQRVSRGCAREPWRFVPVPGNVVAKHRGLHERLAACAAWGEKSLYVQTSGDGELGICAAGFAASKLADVIGEPPRDVLRVCRLGLLHPLPASILGRWLASCREVFVVEETEPFVETALHAISHTHAQDVRILGKISGHLSPEGELFRWQIREALVAWQPGLAVAGAYRREDEAVERPGRESYCGGCRYGEVLDAVAETARELGQQPMLVGDPGCLATIAERLDAKYAIGSAIGVAHGLAMAGAADRVVALFGDSAFFHSALPALCHAVTSRSPIVIIVLDNQGTRTSGNQPHPGVGLDALGRQAPKLSIHRIALACDVPLVRVVRLDNPPVELRKGLSECWAQAGPSLLVVELPSED
jgi:indolepyruvate ferredoxin oxidoreductase alpha subunit